MEKQKAIMRNWFMDHSRSDYKTVLVGEIVEHPRFEKGATVTTSEVVFYDSESGVAKTKNTIYNLI